MKKGPFGLALWGLLVSIHGLEAAPGSKTRFQRLIPQRSCAFSEYYNLLSCNCDSVNTNANFRLELKYYAPDKKIDSVVIEQCNRMKVTLDFTGVIAGEFPIVFKAIQYVDIQDIRFDPTFPYQRELELKFINVDTFEFNGVFVRNTLKIEARNIKDARFIDSYFAHVPTEGFLISDARDLIIKDSVFEMIEESSILVEKTSNVIVKGNKMTINALQVVQVIDGSHFVISCNTLLGEPQTPECTKTTTIPTTTTTMTTTTTTAFTEATITEMSINVEASPTSQVRDAEARSGIYPEIVGGVVAGLLLIIIILIIFICILRRKKRKNSPSPEEQDLEKPLSKEKDEEEEEEDEELKDTSVLMSKIGEGEVDDDDDDDDGRPKFASPIWIDEIHKNKIFNRQKSLLSQDDLKSKITNANRDNEEGREQEEGEDSGIPSAGTTDLTSDEEVRENSRTESDEDFDKDKSNGSAVEADRSYSPPVVEAPKADVQVPIVSPPPMEEDINEMESLLAKVREQERALIEGDF